MTKESLIPQFDLYGDSEQYQNPDFIHIEDIAERSSNNGWKIKPHRHGKMLQVLCVYSGKMTATLDSATYHLEDTWAVVIPPGTVHGFSFLPATDGIVLTIAEPFFSGQAAQQYKAYFEVFCNRSQIIRLNGKNALFNQLTQYADMIKSELNTARLGHELMLTWLVSMFLMNLRRQLELTQLEVKTGESSSTILIGFRQLLEQHFHQHWTVREYAHSLHTSESTLNRLCNEVFGNSTKKIIHHRMVTAMKRRLRFTKQPLDQIAYSLGYQDPSYFSRFFKQQTGTTPSKFRKEKSDDL